MALRDQIINNQREAQRNLWNLLMSLGLDEKHIVELGAKQGIAVEDIKKITPQSPNFKSEGYNPIYHSTFKGQSGVISPCFSPEEREFGSRSFAVENLKLTPFFREEHHASYYYISHGLSPSTNQHWCNNQPTIT